MWAADEAAGDWGLGRFTSIGRGLAFLGSTDDDRWRLVRADGARWTTIVVNGQRLLADPLLYPWLWFMDPAWGAVPAFEVPPQWLEWSDDGRVVSVSRAPHDPQELEDWLAQQPAESQA